MILPGRLKLPTDGCPAFINATPDSAADITQQGDAAWIGAFGSSHYQPKIVQLSGHPQWNAASSVVFGFAPVKRCTVKSAAGTAAQALIDKHFFTCSNFNSPGKRLTGAAPWNRIGSGYRTASIL